MANLSENPQWVDGIYQIETSDPVVGGPDGVSNRQAKELASRTSYLKKEQEKTGSDLATHAAAADPHTQYAPKANPTFTGTPKAPTPAMDSNSQQIATTAFVRSVSATKLAKDQNGADIPDRELFNRNLGSSRAYSSSIPIGGSDGLWTTAEFIGWLESQGAFVHAYWVCRGSWSYAHNKIISDTECGQIPLAGSVVEVMGQNDATTIRITTPSTTPSGLSDSANAQFTYVYNGGDYSPGWRRDYNTKNKPTATDVGALPEKATALAAAKLATPRTINGVPFDGTANIALTPANLGLTETVNLAAGALEKAKNGADISDKTAFISNLIERGHLSDGGTFSACNQPGIYRVGTENPASISDMPKNNNGEYLYYYGVLSVQRIAGVITQVYKNHFGQTATRQSWDDGKVYNNWNVPYDSAINKPTATDVGAITKTDADNNYVRQGSSGVVYQGDELPWNSPTGAYLKDNGPHSSLIWHMGLNSGSASAAQFYFDFANGGIKYRSSRDNSGFEKPWARIYTDQDKPTAQDIGAIPNNEFIGIPMPWPQVTAPYGWLKCNGQTFDKNIYPLLGQTYPSGILPDLRGEFIRGYDDGRSIDPGRELLSLQGFTVQGHTHPSGAYNRGSGTLLYTSVGMQAGGDRVFSETRENENAGTETRPRNIAFNYIVRAA
ncbi:tail fiber protein [Pectobacterium aroidearum]|uniref:Tail fiber protein n=1 Tax=Pectobacterium aroidearum TaxID=1201031 RepID=A0AAW3SN50_9GAMM|nr:phage tail protein [Pectobacterium aroidearum]MBA5202456.1 tail fiber protein [Pectobacterium aroidearum]MBA5600132.1 tail fiber protein [Pectobacterium aroidearum]